MKMRHLVQIRACFGGLDLVLDLSPLAMSELQLGNGDAKRMVRSPERSHTNELLIFEPGPGQ